ncbi:MAG: hypothetical protein ACU0BF_04625 [Paracoccaceae bacterium]
MAQPPHRAPHPRPNRPPHRAAPRPSAPLFLARDAYRQRRLRDVARALPVLGAVLVTLPVAAVARDGATALALGLMLAAWAGCIAGAAILSRVLAPDAPGPDEDASE